MEHTNAQCTHTCTRERGNLETKTKDKSGFETVAAARKAEIFQAKHFVVESFLFPDQ